MMRKFNFDYDFENDSLFLYDPKSKSKGSIEIEDFIIDFNNKKEVSSIEILNASSLLKEIVSVNKETLKEIKDCHIDIIQKSSFFLIKLMLLFKSDRQIATPILVPRINESSPAICS